MTSYIIMILLCIVMGAFAFFAVRKVFMQRKEMKEIEKAIKKNEEQAKRIYEDDKKLYEGSDADTFSESLELMHNYSKSSKAGKN